MPTYCCPSPINPFVATITMGMFFHCTSPLFTFMASIYRYLLSIQPLKRLNVRAAIGIIGNRVRVPHIIDINYSGSVRLDFLLFNRQSRITGHGISYNLCDFSSRTRSFSYAPVSIVAIQLLQILLNFIRSSDCHKCNNKTVFLSIRLKSSCYRIRLWIQYILIIFNGYVVSRRNIFNF